ncbi:MAG: Ig-like domain repeat protein [Micrococcales bacterium]|nr:Ig-like domain repeat protein [Micrococcales bacterium]OJX67374.1 MAG: hypothetical protein BGO94_00595 [Micrococcales bacterium 72-143]
MLRASVRDLLRVVGRQGWRLAAGQFVVGIASAALLTLVAFVMTSIAPVVAGSMTLAQLIGWMAVASGLTLLLLVPLGVAGYAAIVVNTDETIAGRRVRLFRALVRGIRRTGPLGLALLLAVAVPLALTALFPVITIGALLALAATPLVRLLRRRRPEALRHWPSVRALVIAAIPLALALRETARALLLFPAAVLERVGPLQAFRIAGRLVRGRRLRVLALALSAVVLTVGTTLLVSWLVLQAWGEQAAQAAQLVQLVLLPLTLAALTVFYRRAAGPDGRILDPAAAPPADPRRRSRPLPAMARVATATIVALVASVIAPVAVAPAIAVPSGDGVIRVTSPADTPFDADALAAQRASCEADGPDCTVRAALGVAQDLALAGFAGDLVVRFTSGMTVDLAAPDYSVAGGDTVLAFNSLANTATGAAFRLDASGHSVELVGHGSGILSLSSYRALAVSGIVFRGGSAASGGAMTLNAPSASLDSVTVVDSWSSYNGAVYSYAPLTVVNSTFSRNAVGWGGSGADIYAFQPLTVQSSTFIDSDTGSHLGAPPASSVPLTLRDSILARDAGGGGVPACAGFSGLSTGYGNVVPNSDTTCPGIAANPAVSGDPVGKIVGPLTRIGTALVHPLIAASLLGIGSSCPATDAAGRARAAACDPGAAEFDHRSVTAVSTSAGPVLQGSLVTLTATVRPYSEAGVLPQGTVEFLADGVSLATVPATYDGSSATLRAIATAAVNSLTAGTHAITAVFTPTLGTAFDASSSDAVPLEVINPVVLTATPSLVTDGDEVTLQVAVTAGSGDVVIRDVTDGEPGTTIASDLTLVDGRVSTTVDDLPRGARHLVADYLGDAEHDPASSPQTTVTVRPPSHVSLTLDTATAPYGGTVVFTATVETEAGAPVPDGGSVVFDLGPAGQYGPVAVSGGVATLERDLIAGGTHSVVARYSGDPVNGTGASAGEPLTITDAGTIVSVVVVTPNAPQYGSELSFTVTVESQAGSTADPQGSVRVTPDAGDAVTVALSPDGARDGRASIVVTIPAGLEPGAHAFAVAFLADGGGYFAGSALAAPVMKTVALATTRATLTASTTSPSWGDTVELTATVEAPDSDAVPAGGTVTFRTEGGAILGTATVGAGGVATLSASAASLGLGGHQLTADYSGTTRFAASDASDALGISVGSATTTTTVTAPGTVAHGHALAIDIAVTAGAVQPDDGSEVQLVELLDDGAVRELGTVTLAAGEGRLQLHVAGDDAPPLAVGTHRIEARFAGDSRFAASTGVAEVVVLAATTTSTIAVDRASLRYGQYLVVTATVANIGSGSTGLAPVGDIAIVASGQEIARIPAASLLPAGLGKATGTLTIPAEWVGLRELRAEFVPAAGFAASVSPMPAPQVTVDPATTAVAVTLTPAGYGGTATATAQVTVAQGGPGLVPTGQVYFAVNGGDWSQGAPLDGDGRATLPGGIPVTGPGTILVRAWYVPSVWDPRFTAGVPDNSQYGVASTTITRETPTVEVTGWPSIAMSAGAAAPLTVTVTGAGSAPTGQVQLRRAATNVAFGDPVTLTAAGPHTSTATLPLAGLAIGSEDLVVAYDGYASAYNSTASAPATVTVVPARTVTTVTSSTVDGWNVLQPGVVGVQLRYTARVVSEGTPATSGIVTFSRGGVQLGSVPVDATGTASLLVAPSLDWSGTITASFGSYDPTVASSSGTLAHSWTHAPVTVQLGTPAFRVGGSSSVTATVSLDAAWGGPRPATAPQGAVVVTGAGGSCIATLTPLGGGALASTGSCVLNAPATAGADTLTASYPGSGSWGDGTATSNVTAAPGVPQIVFGSSSGSSWIGLDTVRFSWQVQGPTVDGPAIALVRGTQTICTSTARDGYCDYTFEAGTSLTAVANTFRLDYAGDANWEPRSAQRTGIFVSCVPLGTIGFASGTGTLTPITSPNCANGAGYTAGTVARWQVQHTLDDQLSGVTPASSFVTTSDWQDVGQIAVTVTPGFSPIAFGVRIEPLCVPVRISLGVTVAETPNCGGHVGRWVDDGAALTGSVFTGTVLHASATPGYTVRGVPQEFIRWGGDVPEAVRGDAEIAFTVGRRPSGAANVIGASFANICYPLTLLGSAELSYRVTAGSACTNARTGEAGYLAGSYTTVATTTTAPHAYVDRTVLTRTSGGEVDALRGDPGTTRTTQFRMTAPLTLSATVASCVPFSVAVAGINPVTGDPMGTAKVRQASTCPTAEAGWYLPNSEIWIEAADTKPRGMTLYQFVSWSGAAVARPTSTVTTVNVGPAGGVATASFVDPSTCVPFRITVVPAGAIDVGYEVQNSLGRNGCPVGTYDVKMVEMYLGDGGVPITVTATPNATSGANPYIAIGYTTKRFRNSTGSITAVDGGVQPGSSRTFAAYSATDVTVYVCERIYAQAVLLSPNGTPHSSEVGSDSDLIQVSPTPNCPVPGRAAYTVGSQVYLNAGADPSGYRFLGWSGAVTSAETQPLTPIAMDGAAQNATITATYQVVCHQLTSNWASVQVDPAPNCPDTPASENRYIGGTTVTLTATSEGSNLFREWKGAADATDDRFAAVVMSSDKSVYAYFSSKSAGEAISSAFTDLGNALAVAAKKAVGAAAAVASALVAGSNPVFVVMSGVAAFGSALSFITDKLGVQGKVLDAILSGTSAVGTAMEIMQAPFQCGVEWGGSAGSTPSSSMVQLQNAAAGAALGALKDRANAGTQGAVANLVERFYGADAAANVQSAQNASKTFGRVAAVGLAVYQQAAAGNLGWDSSARAAWTDGGAYNACMIRVLSKIPGMPAAPGPGYNYSTMSY